MVADSCWMMVDELAVFGCAVPFFSLSVFLHDFLSQFSAPVFAADVPVFFTVLGSTASFRQSGTLF